MTNKEVISVECTQETFGITCIDKITISLYVYVSYFMLIIKTIKDIKIKCIGPRLENHYKNPKDIFCTLIHQGV